MKSKKAIFISSFIYYISFVFFPFTLIGIFLALPQIALIEWQNLILKNEVDRLTEIEKKLEEQTT